jgi:hypothetical protein
LASSTPSQPGPGPLRRAAAPSDGAAGIGSLPRGGGDEPLAGGAGGTLAVRLGAGAAVEQAPSDKHSSVETNRARMMRGAARGAGIASWYHVRLVGAASGQIHALILCAITLLAPVTACGGAGAGLPVGVSDAMPERSSPAPPPAPRPIWPDFEAARAWPPAAPATPARAHFRDGTLVHVRVEPPGLAAYHALASESPMPADARVVAWHETRAGQLRGGYLLEKRQGVWSAHEIDAAGALVAGDRTACLRCHEMAPTDHLFGALQPAGVPAGAAVPESISPAAR